MDIDGTNGIPCVTYHIYPKYLGTSNLYHTFFLNLIKYNLLPALVSKNCWMGGK